jgi:hypothetical protein
MTVYPMWLLAARAHHVHEWTRLAKSRAAALSGVEWTQQERESFGPTAALLRSTSRPALGGLLDEEALRLCRCFLRGIGRDRRADPLLLMQQAAAAEARGGGGGGASPSVDVKGERDAYRDLLLRERAALQEACSDGTAPSEREQALCSREWSVPVGSAEASTAARLAIRLGGASAEASRPAGGRRGAGEREKAPPVGRSDARVSEARDMGPAHAQAEMGAGLGASGKAGRPHGRRASNSTRVARRQAHARAHARDSHPHAHAHPRRAERNRDEDAQDSRMPVGIVSSR